MIIRLIVEQCLQAAIGEEPTGVAGYVLLAVIAATLLLIAVAARPPLQITAGEPTARTMEEQR